MYLVIVFACLLLQFLQINSLPKDNSIMIASYEVIDLRKQFFMKLATSLLLIVMLLIGCNKERIEPLPSVEVYDYITGQPVQAAEISRRNLSNFSLSCLCYQNISSTLLGFTGVDGKLNDLLSLESIYVKKDKYMIAAKYDHCISEINDQKAIFYLFKIGMFEINATTSQNYTDPIWLNIYPVMKNGNLPKPYYQDDYSLGAPGIRNTIAYAGITNRIIITKQSTTSIPDTLYKADIFLPENLVKQVSIMY